MKSALPLAALLAAFAAGYLVRGCGANEAADELRGMREQLAHERTMFRRADSLRAARQAADSLRRAEDDRRVATSRDTAVALGAAVAPLLDSAIARAKSLDVALDSVLTAAKTALVAHLAADSIARLEEDERHRGDSLRILVLETVTVPELQAERDTAMARADRAVTLGLRAARPSRFWHGVTVGATVVAAVVLLR